MQLRPFLRPRFRLALALGAVLSSPAPAAHGAPSRAYIVTTDFAGTGGLSAIDLASRAVTRDVAMVYKDARARWYDGRVYVLNRFGADNLQVIDPAAGYATVGQFSLGNGANPSDIVLTSPARAYVSLYGRAHIAIVNPATGASLGSIDLSPFADADGLPEADHMARFGRWLFVALERLDEAHGFGPTDSSLVAVIDTQADTVVDVEPALAGKQAILLPCTNPVTAFAWDPAGRRFYLGCVGHYGVLDGGIVTIDPEAFASPGVAITETALGGEVSDVEWHSATRSYAIVTDADFNASLVTWNPATGTKLATRYGPVGGLADCVENDRGELYLCDNSFGAPGVRVFSTATDLPIAGPLDTGLPPYQVVFDGPTGDAPGSASPIEFAVAGPNPARDAAQFRLTIDREREVRVDAFDLAGRRVRSLLHERLAAGAHDLGWDVRDGAGRHARSGVYLVRARLEGLEITRRLIVVE